MSGRTIHMYRPVPVYNNPTLNWDRNLASCYVMGLSAEQIVDLTYLMYIQSVLPRGLGAFYSIQEWSKIHEERDLRAWIRQCFIWDRDEQAFVFLDDYYEQKKEIDK